MLRLDLGYTPLSPHEVFGKEREWMLTTEPRSDDSQTTTTAGLFIVAPASNPRNEKSFRRVGKFPSPLPRNDSFGSPAACLVHATSMLSPESRLSRYTVEIMSLDAKREALQKRVYGFCIFAQRPGPCSGEIYEPGEICCGYCSQVRPNLCKPMWRK